MRESERARYQTKINADRAEEIRKDRAKLEKLYAEADEQKQRVSKADKKWKKSDEDYWGSENDRLRREIDLRGNDEYASRRDEIDMNYARAEDYSRASTYPKYDGHKAYKTEGYGYPGYSASRQTPGYGHSSYNAGAGYTDPRYAQPRSSGRSYPAKEQYGYPGSGYDSRSYQHRDFYANFLGSDPFGEGHHGKRAQRNDNTSASGPVRPYEIEEQDEPDDHRKNKKGQKLLTAGEGY